MIIEVAASEMLLLRMFSQRLDKPKVLTFSPVDERPGCEVELTDFWSWAELEGGPLMIEAALEIMVVWAKGEQETLLRKGRPLFSEDNVPSS